MDKKGNIKQYFVMFELVFAAIVVLGMLLYAKGASESTDLEKEYLAKDMAFLIDSIYASPGDISYTYYLNGNFDVSISKGKVAISENGLRPASYGYAENDMWKNPSFEFKKAKEVTFIKVGKELRVEGRI